MNPRETWTPYRDTKFCFVPDCTNSSRNTQKTFFGVPKSTKQEWCDAVGIECSKRFLYICEDHLNSTTGGRPKKRGFVLLYHAGHTGWYKLEEDVENYLYWKTVQGRPKLKARVPQSLIKTSPSTQDLHLVTEPRPTTSSIMDVGVEMSVTKAHKGVQIKPKTSDWTTYCALHKRKIHSTLVEDDEMTESSAVDEALPSTQGSTTSADISEISSEIAVPSQLQGRSLMLKLIETKPQSYLGLPKNYYWVINYLETKLKVKSFDIIITLFKIRNNTPFYQISDMFEVSLATIWRTFFKTLSILHKFFKQLILSPCKFDIKRNLPSSFKVNNEYSNIYCIIDCFEIEIEKPSNPITQSLTWSQYKNANTLKYLLATTPDGFVNFVSAGYGGRISDASIVESSGLLDVLPPNCTILADRGFKHIDTLLSRKHIKLLRPPSVSKDIKLTKQEAIKSKVIASLRIHVERVIRRVRLFKFLKPHSVINNKLIQHTDEVVIVACGLNNLHNSIVKNE